MAASLPPTAWTFKTHLGAMLRALCDASTISAFQAFVRDLSDPLRFRIHANPGEL
jgi:hypothetical protein